LVAQLPASNSGWPWVGGPFGLESVNSLMQEADVELLNAAQGQQADKLLT
jgi:hypothetical protein